MMVKDLLAAGDLSEGYDDDEKKKDSEEGGDEESDDVALSELGAKYAEKFGAALDDKDWPAAYSAFCRLCELHKYEEDQERGY